MLVSHDVSTMPNHLRTMVAGTTSPGVILIPQRLPIADAIDLLPLLCEAAEREDVQDPSAFCPAW